MAAGSTERIQTPLPGLKGFTTASEQARYGRWFLVLWYLGMLGLTGLIAAGMLWLGPSPALIGWAVLLIGVCATLYNPRYGVYILLGFGLAADGLLTPWFPMMKNLSSAESLLYLHNALVFNLAEFFIGLTTLSWLGRAIFTRKFELVLGNLVIPALIFMAFAGYGFVAGVLRGGDFTIALWSSRAIFYYPMLLLLTSQVIKTQQHVLALIWAAAFGMTFDAINGFNHVAFTLAWDTSSVLRIAEHSHSIHVNSLFVLLIALFYYRASPRLRWFLLLALPFLLVSYLGNQRRASYVALGIALVMFGLLQQWYNRKLFWTIIPPLAMLFVIYLGVFWNSTAAPAVIAQQVRAIVAPVDGSEDESSNLYRETENINNLFTIRQEPLTGVGFGRKFYLIAPMPDISFFAWWEYIVHNSVIWIWMETGIGGFLSMLFLWGSTIMLGMRRMFSVPPGLMRAIAFMAVSFVVMHATYAYVDMSWDGQSMILLGVMSGLINIFGRIIDNPPPPPARRWPWQPEPVPPARMQMT